jgi:hypothetical protein
MQYCRKLTRKGTRQILLIIHSSSRLRQCHVLRRNGEFKALAFHKMFWEKKVKGRNNECKKRHSSIIALALLASLLVEGMSVSALAEVNPLFTYQDYFLSIYYRQKKKCYLFCFFKYSLYLGGR